MATPIDAFNLNEDSLAIQQIQAFLPSLQLYIPFTAVQTASSVSAVANTFVLVSTASNSVTVNFPVAPANFTVVGVKMVVLAGSNTVTLQLGGSDHFDTTTGAQSGTMPLLNQSGLWQYNSATAVWVKVSDNLSLSQLDLRYVNSVANGDNTITIGGTTVAPTAKVNQPNLTLAQSQITGLSSALAPNYSAGAQWAPNVYGTLYENLERDDANSTLIMASGFRTWLVLLGLVPAGTYSTFKLYLSAVATGTAGVYTCALFGGSSMTNTSWARLGSGNVTLPSLTGSPGLISTSLSFTLATPTYVALEMVVTTAPGTLYPTFAASGAVTSGATFLNPTSGCPVFGQLNASTAPASTLNPTTGFTAQAQKIWCALA